MGNGHANVRVDEHSNLLQGTSNCARGGGADWRRECKGVKYFT